MSDPYVPNPLYFERVRDGKDGQRYYVCKVCHPRRERRSQNCRSHEQSKEHKDAVNAFHHRAASPPPATTAPTTSLTDDAIKEDALRAFLVSCSGNPDQPLYPLPPHDYPEPNFPTTSRSPSPVTGIDWNLHEYETTFGEEDLDGTEIFKRQVCQATLDLLNGDISDYDLGMHPESSSDSDDSFLENRNDLPQKRARAGDVEPKISREWFPWSDRVTCTLDILMHLPRSVFSRRQLELFLWLLRINGVGNVPTTSYMTSLNKTIQNMCGIDTIQYEGKMGHPYHVNSLAQILAQEMSNPKVRPYLHFYPEDSHPHLEETRQASKWLDELPPEQATPMIRTRHNDDYYIFEPTLLTTGTFCVPFRWFTRRGKFWGRGWIIKPTQQGDDRYNEGWVVYKNEEVKFSEDALLKAFPRLCQEHKSYDVPHPSHILGVQDPLHPALQKWDHTDPVKGNRWRDLAKGHRTLAVPLWTYCDDTSGNQSKKWNKHNSFLVTLAGLPREHVSKEYNIHFLCTSNLAPPLEMMDGVVEQIQKGQSDGFWAWDYLKKEPILLIPSSISLVGDNPMQSEFCCHVGSRGKFFCRICMVKGTDAEDSRTRPPRPDETPPNSPAPSNVSDGEVSQAEDNNDSPTTAGPTKRKRVAETMEAMVRRITDFMKIGTSRTKANTLKTLDTFLDFGKTLYSKTKLTKARTETGVKDTMQDFFINKLTSSYKKVPGSQRKEQALKAAIDALPDKITSPVWRLGLDPHQDTPVEILHVVLLGFVKYFWRDLVQNQINDDQKQTLIARLNSFNVQGLGISPLAGATLVNYAGSLVGRDFRAICQVAPFVIRDMVSEEVFDAWFALSTLIPLIWQPVIENVDNFCATLEAEIQNFLIKTVRWTCGWFNKSKFHILLHLPYHIRRLGPAILFATEAFESFNAVIRAKSIHSNRQAPSRDIALAFAQGNRIRHLMSGGFVPAHESVDKWKKTPQSVAASDWKTIGPGPSGIMAADPTPASYLGLLKTIDHPPGYCKSDKTGVRPWPRTLSGRYLPSAIGDKALNTLCKTCSQVTLENHDVCPIGQHVIIHTSPGSSPFIARVQEIVQFYGQEAEQAGLPDGILVQTVQHNPGPIPFPMPRLTLQNIWSFVSLSQILCTVNVQHDCHRHRCQPTGVRYIVQERARSQLTTPVVEHRTHPEDLILNMAQMRDAIHLQKFRQASISVDNTAQTQIIHESVARAIDMRKTATTTQASRGRGVSRGRGRGARPQTPPASLENNMAGVPVLGSPGRGRGRGRGRGQGLGLPLAPPPPIADSTTGTDPPLVESARRGRGSERGLVPPPQQRMMDLWDAFS